MIRRRLFLLSLVLFGFVLTAGLPALLDGSYAGLTDEENINAGSPRAGYWNGNITIIKDAVPNTSQTVATLFTFTPTGAGLPSTADFTLEDDGLTSDGVNQQPKKEYIGIAPGVYTFTEQAKTGYKISLIECDITGDHGSTIKILGDTTAPIDDLTFGMGDNKVEITLAGGDAVECTFKNEPVEGNINITKETLPAQVQNFAFASDVDGHANFNLSNGQTRQMLNLIAPDTYTISETPLAGFEISDISCTGDNDSEVTFTGAVDGPTDDFEAGDNAVVIELAPGETVNCTFENTEKGEIIIVKKTSVANTSGNDFDFEVKQGAEDIASTSLLGSVAGQSSSAIPVSPGTYTVAELAPPSGWAFTSVNCGSGATSPANRTATIEVDPGETVTCTFQNTATGTLVVTKTVVGGTAEADDWTLSVKQGGNDVTGSPAVGLAAPGRSYTLAAGAYNVTEAFTVAGGPLGYALTYSGDCDANGNVTVVALASRTCVLTNIFQPSSIKITKDAVPNDLFDFGFTTTAPTGVTTFGNFQLDDDSGVAGATNVLSNFRTVGNLPPGVYSVDENSLANTEWEFYTLTCPTVTGTGTSVNIVGDKVTITIGNAGNATVECVFVNRLAIPQVCVDAGFSYVGNTSTVVILGEGGTTYAGGNQSQVIFGTNGVDDITGDNAKDCIVGRGGDDEIDGGNGDDIILGGPGDDYLDGGNGPDTLIGGETEEDEGGDYCVFSGEDTYSECEGPTDLDLTIVGTPSGEDLTAASGFSARVAYTLTNASFGDITSISIPVSFTDGNLATTPAAAQIAGSTAAVTASWSCNLISQTWTCNGDLAEGESVTLTFMVNGAVQAAPGGGPANRTVTFSNTALTCTGLNGAALPDGCIHNVASDQNYDDSDLIFTESDEITF